jgi:ubiquinone/menaquinone biosynthesis C-methylase UbiE
MRALSHLEFGSLLDVGAAEGFKAHIARQLFDADAKCSDLSEVACRRAREIFQIESMAADIHNLPFRDDGFDVVLCSETLEHVPDLPRATQELLRVARKAVVITVPHEPQDVIDQNIAEEIPHAHIHSLGRKSFDFVEEEYGHRILTRKMIGSILRIPTILVEAMPREHHDRMKYSKGLIDLYNASLPVLRKIFGKRAATYIIRLDDLICKSTSSYDAVLFIILKEDEAFAKDRRVDISPARIMEFAVPFHLQK